MLFFSAPAKGRKSEAAANTTPATTPAREESRASTPAGELLFKYSLRDFDGRGH